MKAVYLYLVILLEGYVVLSSELLAIRLLVPFVGNGTETVAIIIAGVLMPLSLGYYVGGSYTINKIRIGKQSIRNKLIKNVITSSVILILGLSYILLEIYFAIFEQLGMKHRVVQAAVYTMIFMVYPVYLLGQTVPLVSNYFKGTHLSKATGTILTFSTIGSFIGATFSTLVLMSTIGVHNVAVFNIVLLLIVVVVLNKKLYAFSNFGMIFMVIITYIMNGDSMMRSLGIVENNNYSLIVIEEGEEEGTKNMIINRSFSAKFSENPKERFDHVQYIENYFLNHLPQSREEGEKKSILVIGAGGFTIGQDDKYNDYTFIDIDPSLKRISEEYLFERKLNENHKFIAIPARAFLNGSKEKYDLIFLDAFTNVISTPYQLITKEFFQQSKSHLKDDGILLFNVIASPVFKTRFSVKIDNTFRKVFPNYNRHVIKEYNGWNSVRGELQDFKTANIIYSYHNINSSKGDYTDNINTYFLDR